MDFLKKGVSRFSFGEVEHHPRSALSRYDEVPLEVSDTSLLVDMLGSFGNHAFTFVDGSVRPLFSFPDGLLSPGFNFSAMRTLNVSANGERRNGGKPPFAMFDAPRYVLGRLKVEKEFIDALPQYRLSNHLRSHGTGVPSSCVRLELCICGVVSPSLSCVCAEFVRNGGEPGVQRFADFPQGVPFSSQNLNLIPLSIRQMPPFCSFFMRSAYRMCTNSENELPPRESDSTAEKAKSRPPITLNKFPKKSRRNSLLFFPLIRVAR